MANEFYSHDGASGGRGNERRNASTVDHEGEKEQGMGRVEVAVGIEGVVERKPAGERPSETGTTRTSPTT